MQRLNANYKSDETAATPLLSAAEITDMLPCVDRTKIKSAGKPYSIKAMYYVILRSLRGTVR